MTIDIHQHEMPLSGQDPVRTAPHCSGEMKGKKTKTKQLLAFSIHHIFHLDTSKLVFSSVARLYLVFVFYVKKQ